MLVASDEGRWRLSGPLTMKECAGLTLPLARAAREGGEVDLAAVSVADSAALALLLDARRTSIDAGRALAFCNLPAGLVSLARLYGVEALLERDAS
ncbi:STAS domain-containing protein [Crenobacter cavernae]|uniref:STAS domain-containing protein n=1 Tax=Crenobacter cavernae TaxID=2290923 RepID=A0A345Y5I8_9NEIS|nr:STAS domain-containing protein [Crenobacter cavernae]AXK39190.1 STAS domain-containing protein [Crenobacter cavernae]RXZ44057.1 STAS domain-containing protein [Crenobacter cavernae]